MNAEQTLKSLRDVDGVLGSFVFQYDGSIVLSDLPAFFDIDALRQASPRITSLIETLNSRGTKLTHFVLRYSSHVVWVQPFASLQALCVIAPIQTNLASLRMGINLVTRKLPGVLAALDDRAEIESSHTLAADPSTPVPIDPNTEPSSSEPLSVSSLEAVDEDQKTQFSSASRSIPGVPGARSRGTTVSNVSRVPGSRRGKQRYFRGRLIEESGES